jgi:hypothetical protein
MKCTAILPGIEIDEYTTESDPEPCEGELDENLICTRCGKQYEKMPTYIRIGKVCVTLSHVKDTNIARYWREAGCWGIYVLRRPNGDLEACHEEPFPVSIVNEIVTECTREEWLQDNQLNET